ncbi:hypothetical protein BH20VER1_BH20VER1_22730 [soil metagenome]
MSNFFSELKARNVYKVAVAYAIAAWLEKAYEDRDVRLSFFKVDPRWDAIRSDPRFVSIMKRIGLD